MRFVLLELIEKDKNNYGLIGVVFNVTRPIVN